VRSGKRRWTFNVNNTERPSPEYSRIAKNHRRSRRGTSQSRWKVVSATPSDGKGSGKPHIVDKRLKVSEQAAEDLRQNKNKGTAMSTKEELKLKQAEAKAQVAAAEATAKALRPWFRKKRFIVPGAFVGLVAIGSGMTSVSGPSITSGAPLTVAALGTESTSGTFIGVKGEPNEIADVVMDGTCSGESGLGRMPILITNNSSKPSDYSVETVFFDAAGVQIGDGYSSVQNVAPGAKAKDNAGGFLSGESDVASCKIVSVDRFSAA
jgi:hypothetical protein